MPRGAKPGERRGGRQKGTPNKKTQGIAERLKELGCDPLEGMVEVAKEAMIAKDHALALSAYKELSQYIYPKRKAIEVTGEDGGPIQTQPIGISGIACNTDTGEA